MSRVSQSDVSVGFGPPGYTVRLAAPEDGPSARRFCLDAIDEVFGHGYRPDWHDDLDALLADDHEYLPARRGAFLLVEHENCLVGTAGLRALGAKPRLVARFGDRYPEPSMIGSVWRTYLDPAHRRQGVGSAVMGLLEEWATALGYHTLYLHTSGHSPRAVAFWRSQGYQLFATDEGGDATVHFDKVLT